MNIPDSIHNIKWQVPLLPADNLGQYLFKSGHRGRQFIHSDK